MLKVIAFTFNPFQENTYLIVNDKKECWIVDPGMYGADEERKLIDYIESNQLTPKMIINTHAHIDHIPSGGSMPVLFQHTTLHCYASAIPHPAVN